MAICISLCCLLYKWLYEFFLIKAIHLSENISIFFLLSNVPEKETHHPLTTLAQIIIQKCDKCQSNYNNVYLSVVSELGSLGTVVGRGGARTSVL